jgi:hypothetical protein
MVVAEPAEHEIGGLGTEGEHSLAGFEGRSHLRQSKPNCSRSRIPQPIGCDDNPLRRDAKRPGQYRVHSAVGLVGQDIVSWPAFCALCCRGAVQEQFKARAVDRGEIVPELGKSDTAARDVRSAVCHYEAGRAPATHLAVIDMRKAWAWAVVVAREDYRGRAVAHLHQIDELARILRRPMRVEEDRARFRPDDRDRPRAGAQ